MPIREILGQQTFMGASIVNFNLQLKYDNSPSTMDINLIVDKDNKVTPEGGVRGYDAREEGYHVSSATHAPLGLAMAAGGIVNLYANTGDFFYPAELGSPVWFNYYRYDKDTITEVVTRRPVIQSHPWYFNGLLMAIGEDHSTSGGRLINVRIEDPRKILAGTQVILSSHTRAVAPADGSYGVITVPLNRKFEKGYVGFYNTLNVFGMIEEIQGFGAADRNKSGLVWYDPLPGKMAYRNILEILQILLMGQTLFAGGGVNWQRHGTHAINFPTFIEPAGYQPHPYWGEDYFLDGEERFGGPPYYVTNKTNTPEGPARPGGGYGTTPTNAYRYKVDLSDLSFLTKGIHPDAILGRSHRVNAPNISLLDLITQICKAANADFFVELLPDAAPWPPNVPGNIIPLWGKGVSGVIKIRVIHRVKPPVPGLLLRHIEASKKDPHDIPNPPFDIWRGRLASTKIGYEFGDVVMGTILIGGPKTRVVGVTELGTDRIRNEYVSPLNALDILREWTQYDGVRPPDAAQVGGFAGTNKHIRDGAVVAQPATGGVALPEGRKIALAIPHPAATQAPVATEKSDYRNDIWNAEEGNQPHLMKMAPTFSPVGPDSNVQSKLPNGDDKIDLFPAWGISDREDYCRHMQNVEPCNAIIGCSWDGGAGKCVQTVDLPLKDQPVIGFFDSDEPTKDFNSPTDDNIQKRRAGLMYTVQWVVPNCDVILPLNPPNPPTTVLGGIYNEAACSAENEYKGGPTTPNPSHTRPRIRRIGGGCLDSGSRRMIPAVGKDECLCGRCMNNAASPAVVMAAHKNRKDCEGNGFDWTVGTWDAVNGNCASLDATDTTWSDAAGSAALPQTATIEIDMSEVVHPTKGTILYSGGDDYGGAFPRRKHIYKATVTELRAAAESKDSWLSYATNFNQNLMEHMGWSGQAELNSIFETMWYDAVGGFNFGHDLDDHLDPGGIHGYKVSEVEKMMTTLPIPVGIGNFSRDPAIPVADSAGLPVDDPANSASYVTPRQTRAGMANLRARAFRADRAQFVSEETGIGELIELIYGKIKDVATNWYGKKYFMPLPFDPEMVDQHVREIKIQGAAPGALASKPSFEQDWDISSAGWVDIDMKAGGGRNGMFPYPQNFDFYDDTGKLQPFFVYPEKYVDKDGGTVSLNHSQVAKGAKHKTLNSNIRGYDTTNHGKLFVKARIDAKTYWLWDPQGGILVEDDAPGGDPIVKQKVLDGSEQWFLEKVKEYDGNANTAAQDVYGDADAGPTPLRLKPYALLTLEGNVYHGPSNIVRKKGSSGGIFIGQKELLTILEFLFPDPDPRTSPIQINSIFRPGADWIKARLGPAAFKPYEAAAPQRSNRESWGPWGGGISFGKVIVKKDDNLSPENAGSITALNDQAKAQARSTLVSQQIAETGNVELTGPPEYFLGRPIVVVGVDIGPYITGITVDVNASAGISTTYTMRNWIPELPGGPVPAVMGAGGMGGADAIQLIMDRGAAQADVAAITYDLLTPVTTGDVFTK